MPLMYWHGADGREVCDEARELGRLLALAHPEDPRPFENTPDPARPLRIGYLSQDFRNQAAGHFAEPLFEHHDPAAFQLYGYYCNFFGNDELTARLRSKSAGWVEIQQLNDAALAERVRGDQIDILVDLGMHMAHNRLLLFGRKPAPVQLSWFAYPGTTGLACIDYRLSDRFLDPPELGDDAYTEATWRLPDSFWCWEPLLPALDVGQPPCLANGYVTFGSLNNFCKLNDAVLELWALALAATPTSRLLLMVPPGSARARVTERLAQHGIRGERLMLVGHRPRRAYFELYRQIDIALDPLPYHGHTTSIDALWMGVPVLSLLLAGGLTLAAVIRSEPSQADNKPTLHQQLSIANHP